MPDTMISQELTFIGGLLLGLASSPHCAAMCGPIASSFIMCAAPGANTAARSRSLLFAQLGKSISYIGAGALLGAVGSQFYMLMDRDTGFRVLQWLSSLTLIAIGFSLMGVLPFLAAFNRIAAPVTLPMHRLAAASAAKAGRIAPPGVYLGAASSAVASGVIWGLVPCGMVYAALFSAMLSGSPQGAAMIMTGFALGVLPAVTATALSISSLPRFIRSDTTRLLIGLAIVLIGFLGIWASAPQNAMWCLP